MSIDDTLEPLPLPVGITSSHVDCTASCGLTFHVLTAGTPGNPLILFCHGFPELAFSWRKILPSIAAAGYYCVAMDQRGFGRTTGWPTHQAYDAVHMAAWTIPALVCDQVCLVYRLGYTHAACIVGHDLGGVTAAQAALMRPDVFRASVQMSHPHHAPAAPPLGDAPPARKVDIQADLAKLDPPRKHYKWYNSTPFAARDWEKAPQELARFLRGYFHLKSADWPHNDPRPLTSWTAEALASMPEYYILQKQHTFPESVAANMAEQDYTSTESWLPPDDLAVYVREWTRTGFQGALNWYRRMTMPADDVAQREMLLWSGRRIEVPVAFITGRQDWGNYQQPGAIEGYEREDTVAEGCFRGATFIEGAGHWVQQEQPKAAVKALLQFLESL